MLKGTIQLLKPVANIILISIAALASIAGLSLLVVELLTRSRILTPDKTEDFPIGIVFGAGLRRDGTPTTVLRDRVATAADLYFKGKIKILLMSGDNRFPEYNEPGAMRAFAINLGVPEKDIVLDYAGRRTYDTCYRAMHIFKVSKAIVVTQRYHLPRTLLICKHLGLRAVGVPADRRHYWLPNYILWKFREILATMNALIDILVTKPQPILGEPEPIFLNTNEDDSILA